VAPNQTPALTLALALALTLTLTLTLALALALTLALPLPQRPPSSLVAWPASSVCSIWQELVSSAS
jgi:hypothetical protein